MADPESSSFKLQGEKTPLVQKNRAGVTEFCCRSCAWVTHLSTHFGGMFLLMLFASQHLIKGFINVFVVSTSYVLVASYGVGASQMQIYSGVWMLPWALKPVLGLVSDCFPIFGFSKSPYMLLSCIAGAFAFVVIGIDASWLSARTVVVALVFVMLMIATCSLLSEARYAQMMKDVPDLGPDIVSYVWVGLEIAGIVAAFAAGPVVDYWNLHSMYLLLIVPVVFTIVLLLRNGLMEKPFNNEEVSEMRARMFKQAGVSALCVFMFMAVLVQAYIGATISSVYLNLGIAVLIAVTVIVGFTVVFRPFTAKVYAFYVIQTSLFVTLNGGSFYFFTDDASEYPEGPHFSMVYFLTVLGVACSALSVVGIYAYQQYWKNWTYRTMMMFNNLVLILVHLFDCAIFSRLNMKLGIPDHMFVFGAGSLQTTLYQWMWVPGVVMLAQISDKDSASTMFALLQGCHNVGKIVGVNLGALLLHIMDVQPHGDVGETEQFANLWKCAGLAALCPLVTLALVPFLIPDARQTDRLTEAGASRP